MRRDYVMTEDDLAKLTQASQPTRYMIIGTSMPSSPQENANRAWAELGQRMGFDHMTVQPVYGSLSDRYFTAESTKGN